MGSSLIEPRTRGFVLRAGEHFIPSYRLFVNAYQTQPLVLKKSQSHRFLLAGTEVFSIYSYDEEVVTQLIQWQNMRVILGLDPKVRVIGGFVEGKCNVERI